MTNYIVGLIAGRHDMPVKAYILNEVENVFDFDLMANKIENWINFQFSYFFAFEHCYNMRKEVKRNFFQGLIIAVKWLPRLGSNQRQGD